MKRRGPRPPHQPNQQQGNGHSVSPYPDGSPTAQSGEFASNAAAADDEEDDLEDLLPSGPGALELDEDAAAAATSSA